MNINDLPRGDFPQALEFKHFPARHQAVIWRNWGMLSAKRLADVLCASEADIIEAAEEMGLAGAADVESKWLTLGYVTIIRANWHLLPYSQLLKLLGWSPEKLAFHLKEDDFLFNKLGYLKPACDEVKYRPLAPREAETTREIRKSVKLFFSAAAEGERPFDFIGKLRSYKSSAEKKSAGKFDYNFIYSYFASYGDALMNPDEDPFPEGILRRYADIGVKGIWLQTILYTMCPMEGAGEYSKGWEERLKNLNALTERAGRNGLKVYIYLNEPRGMLEPFFKKFPKWKGVKHPSQKKHYALCTSEPKVLKWLQGACEHVFREVPGLGGAFTITMSENLTNCHSKGSAADCPRCSGRSKAEIIDEVNRAIEAGVHSASPRARVICWNWAWDMPGETAGESTRRILELLPDNVDFMAVSERGKELNIGGIPNRVSDYSISNPGPSEASLKHWSQAKKRGMKVLAKVQLNTSWECSALPYLPVPYLIEEHLNNLRRAGVDGLMLSWSLGGYPGGNLELLYKSPEELALENFGDKAAEIITDAWKIFGDAFREFPFHVGVLYRAPHNMGPANLLFHRNTGYRSTMVGFPYDDLEKWRANYPEEIFERQLKMLSEGWASGLERLVEAEPLVGKEKYQNFEELTTVSTAAYCHFRSAYNQTRFVRIRNKVGADFLAEIELLLDEEIDLAKKLHTASKKDSTIGFEATNHYAYTANDLMEKVLNCLHLKKIYGELNHED